MTEREEYGVDEAEMNDLIDYEMNDLIDYEREYAAFEQEMRDALDDYAKRQEEEDG